MFRGAGYSLLARFGQIVAILVTGVTFGLVHGLIEALVVLTAFGIGLAWLRARTDSVSVHGRALAVQRRGAHRRGNRDDLSGLYPRGVRTALALGVFLALAAPAAAVGEQDR